MRRESIAIFILAALISAGIVGALSYWHHVDNLKPLTGQTPPVGEPQKFPATKPDPQGNLQPTGKPSQQLLSTPQKCIGPEGNVIYTDQPDCADAMPTSNFSVVDSVSAKPKSESKTRSRQGNNSQRTKKPSLQLGSAPSPSSDAPRECKFPLGKAHEIERSLSVAKKPSESIWRESYCKWIREARQKGCSVTSKNFHYLSICSIY